MLSEYTVVVWSSAAPVSSIAAQCTASMMALSSAVLHSRGLP